MIQKKYLNLDYTTIYYPFKEDGTSSPDQSISSSYNFGGNKKIEVGGGKTTLEDTAVQGFYGPYCIARGLLGFDTDDWDSSLSSQSSLQATLRLYHLPSTNWVPSTLTIEVYPLTASWIAGTYTDAVLETAPANWWYRDTTNQWSTSGGWDVDASLSTSIELTPSNKHIELDISEIVKHGLSSTDRFYGLLLKLPDADETATGSINFKKEIYTGDFTLPHMLPRIDIQWDSYVQDDRFYFLAGQESRLYFYNYINGRPSSIDASSITAEIRDDNSNTIVSTDTVIQDPNHPGFYYADITFPLSAYKDWRKYYDYWTFNFAGNEIEKHNVINVISPLDDTYITPNTEKLKFILDKKDSQRKIDFNLQVKENQFHFFKTWSGESAEVYVPSEAYYRVYLLLDDIEREKYYVTDWDRVSSSYEGLKFSVDKTQFPMGKYYLEFKMSLFGDIYYWANRKHYFRVEEDFLHDQSTLLW